MVTYEERTLVTCDDLPPGYKVEYCEIRGYDSPDKWYEAFGPEGKIGEFARKEQAIAACLNKRITRPNRFERI